MTNLTRSLVLGCSVLALAACGPTDIASPGSGGNITINNPPAAPAPSPSPSPSGPALVTPASGCPTISDAAGLADGGTITGPTGTYRVCTLPAVLRTSSTLPKLAGVVYQLNGRVNVGCDGGRAAPTTGASYVTTTPGCGGATLTADTNVVLTIEPGVIVYGGTGQSWLAVNRGNRINAAGTATQPIIFTSRDNVLGLNTDSSQGQWGGVVLMGRATTTDCTGGGVAKTVGNEGITSTCERATEGSADPALFGGNIDNDNSGRISYAQIRYSGFILGSNIELQALTTEGIGSATVLDHIQTVNSSDDGAEFFGGVFNMKYYIAVGADDDSMDVDTGAQANFQYVILAQRAGRGDALFEIDSTGAAENQLPRTKLQVANFTAIAGTVSSPDNEANDQASALFRGNSDTTLLNGLIVAPANECVRLNGTTVSGSAAVTLTARSVALSCNATKYIGNGTFNATSVGAVFAGNGNNEALTSTLTSVYINGANETAIAAATLNPAFSTFFDNRAWIGAVQNSADNWWAGWTCNSTTANFGTGNSGNCTSLPVT